MTLTNASYKVDKIFGHSRVLTANLTVYLKSALTILILSVVAPGAHAQGEVTVSTLGNVVGNGGIVVHPDSNELYIGDFGNLSLGNGTELWILDQDGNSSQLRTDMGRSNAGGVFDSTRNFYMAAFNSNVVYKITPEGVLSTFASVNGPVGVAIDSADNIYVASCNNNQIIKYTLSGTATVLASGGGMACANGIALDDDENIYVCNWADGSVIKSTPAGTTSLFAVVPGGGNGHCAFANDTLYVAARTTHRVFQIDMSGNVTLLAGTGIDGNGDGAAATATFSRPNGLAVSPDGRYVFTNGKSSGTGGLNAIRKIDLGLEDEPFEINFGVAGGWYEPVNSGQGFKVDVIPTVGQLVMGWFTHGQTVATTPGDPNLRWWTLQGPYTGNTVDLTIYETTGGKLDDPQTANTLPVGSAILTFTSCDNATLDYSFTNGPADTIDLIPLLSSALCQSLESGLAK